jgi:RNA polymerase sigma-70 factor (ECF subfamily)
MSQGQLVNQFLEHRDAILGFILALTHDYDVAEDVFQEVAKVILEQAQQATAVSRFMPWAREIARRRVAEFYRRSARSRSVENTNLEEVVCQAFEENEGMLEDSQARFKALLECRESLSERNRELIDGFYRDRLSIRAVASTLGWTENSVKSALWRVRKALAECIRHKLRSREKISR